MAAPARESCNGSLAAIPRRKPFHHAFWRGLHPRVDARFLKWIEAAFPPSIESAVSDLRESFWTQVQYGIGLALQKGLPYLLIPLIVSFYGDRTYSSYVLFCASTLMFTNLTALALPNAVVPFWYAEKDKRTVSWTFLLLLLGAQIGLSLFMALVLNYIYGQSFGPSAATRLTLLGLLFAFLSNFNAFLTGVCRARNASMSFLIAQLVAGTVLVTGVVLFRGRQQLDTLVVLFLVFLLCQDLYLIGSIIPYLRHSRPQLDLGLARRVFRYSLPLIPHLETIAFCFWVDKYLVRQYFTVKQFSEFTVSFQYALAQAFIAQVFAMYTFPLFCRMVRERDDSRLRSLLRTYNLIFAVLGAVWVAGLLGLQFLRVSLQINTNGFLILGIAFALWNVASNYVSVQWARFNTRAVTVVTISSGLILIAFLFLGCWTHILILCYLSHLGWALAALVGLIWLEHKHSKEARAPVDACDLPSKTWTLPEST